MTQKVQGASPTRDRRPDATRTVSTARHVRVFNPRVSETSTRYRYRTGPRTRREAIDEAMLWSVIVATIFASLFVWSQFPPNIARDVMIAVGLAWCGLGGYIVWKWR